MNSNPVTLSRHTILLQTFLLAGGIFAFDTQVSLNINGGIAYVVVVLVSLTAGSYRFTLGVSLVCAALIIGRIFMFTDLSGVDWRELLTNRFLAVFSVWITAALGTDRLKSEAALRDAQNELERRVEERTAELARANDELRAEMSDRIEAQQASREIEDRTGIIIDHALDAIIAIDPTGVVMTWNRQAEVIFGWPRYEALGEPLNQMVLPAENHNLIQDSIQAFMSGGDSDLLNKRTTISAVHRNGNEFRAEISIVPVPWKESYLFSAFVRSISPAEPTPATDQAESHSETNEAANESAGNGNEADSSIAEETSAAASEDE